MLYVAWSFYKNIKIVKIQICLCSIFVQKYKIHLSFYSMYLIGIYNFETYYVAKVHTHLIRISTRVTQLTVCGPAKHTVRWEIAKWFKKFVQVDVNCN